MRGDLGRAGAGRGDRAGAVRAGSARQGRAGGLRALPAGRPRRAAGRRADRGEHLGRVHGRRAGQGRPAARAVHGPGPGAAARRPGAVRRRDPARAAGNLRYVHVACTGFLTAMHTGDRTNEAINAGGVLPGYAGTIVRDGYKGYEHLTSALHAWCGAHGLRDLAGLYRFDPDGQVWARSMADLLMTPTPPPPPPQRQQGQPQRRRPGAHPVLVPRRRRQGHRRQPAQPHQIGKDGLRLARRFRDHEDVVSTSLSTWPSDSLQIRRNGTSAGQGAAARLRRDLAHPARTGRLRDRPVLPVHRWQVGRRRPRRSHPAIHRRPLAPAAAAPP